MRMRALKQAEDNVHVASYLETQSTINPARAAAHFQTNLFLPELAAAAIRAPVWRIYIKSVVSALTARPMDSENSELSMSRQARS
jgi:hypothetical protein